MFFIPCPDGAQLFGMAVGVCHGHGMAMATVEATASAMAMAMGTFSFAPFPQTTMVVNHSLPCIESV
jgi:hypothetical protein